MPTHPLYALLPEIALAAALAWGSGLRLYAVLFMVGLAGWTGWLALPEHLSVLSHPLVLGASGFMTVVEFGADKVPWLDSLWDLLHTAIRPIGGAALALAIIDPSQPGWQAVVFLLGGGSALLAHGGKAGLRGAINMSPEPFTNVVASSVEDVATAGLLSLVYAFPVTASAVAAILFGMVCALVLTLRRAFRRVTRKRKPPDGPPET